MSAPAMRRAGGSASGPVTAHVQLRSFETELVLPSGTDILVAREPEPLSDVRGAVLAALEAPTGSASLADLCAAVLTGTASAAGAARPAPNPISVPSAVVVVSDNTRAVPYKRDSGILWPLVEALLSAGLPPESVTLLVASGTHRVLSDDEMWTFLDERARYAGVGVRCHDAADPDSLTCVGRRKNGDEVFVSTAYMEADLRILTGLVEPHLLAGVSGGRKSICPGLLDVNSVRDFHGAKTLAHPKATSLVLDGNPCHEVSLEISRMAPPDLILNVTTCRDGRVAGVFAGDMQQAHLLAVEQIKESTQIPLDALYDVVVTHGGLVGLNHYQAQKAIDVAARAVRPGGYLVVIADTTDLDPVGTGSYRRLLELLAEVGAEEFLRRIMADDWEFAHDQWGVQMWAHILHKVPADHIFYFSPQTAPADYAILPSVDPLLLIDPRSSGDPGEIAGRFVNAAVERACRDSESATGRPATVAYLADGPHGVPIIPT